MRRFLTIIVVILAVLAVSIPLFLAQGRGRSIQAEPLGNTYTEEDLMARYTRDRMFYQVGERGEINFLDRSKYYEILKKVLADYPQSSFVSEWQLAIARDTNKLEGFQKVVRNYPGNDFICAIAYTKMGEIYRSMGEEKMAGMNFQRALSLADECIKSEPKNAAYNYHKAIIKLKEKNETFDYLQWEEKYPEGRLMQADIFSEFKKGSSKPYTRNPFLEVHNIARHSASIQESSRRLKFQGAYYEKKGEIDKAIETYETMLKIGKHYQNENQILLTELTVSFSMWGIGQIFLERLFEKNNMIERKKELEIANKVVEERRDRINLIRGIADAYGKVMVNKDLSELPPEAQADPEKTIMEFKEEVINAIDENSLIKDKNLEARIFISYLLSKLGGERAMDILKEGLSDKDPYVRFFVGKLLEEQLYARR